MAKTISWSLKSGNAIDFTKELRYPLCPAPLSIAFQGGIKQSTAKRKLLKGLDVSDEIFPNISEQTDAYIIDLMAEIQNLHGKPGTFEVLALKLVNCVPIGVTEVHFVADSYLHNSIKPAERKIPIENRTVIIKSIKS